MLKPTFVPASTRVPAGIRWLETRPRLTLAWLTVPVAQPAFLSRDRAAASVWRVSRGTRQRRTVAAGLAGVATGVVRGVAAGGAWTVTVAVAALSAGCSSVVSAVTES